MSSTSNTSNTSSIQHVPRFDYRFHLRYQLAASKTILNIRSPFGSIVHQALGCNREALGNSRRFERRWTEVEFAAAVAHILQAGYRLVDVRREPAPEPGSPSRSEPIDMNEFYDIESGVSSTLKKGRNKRT